MVFSWIFNEFDLKMRISWAIKGEFLRAISWDFSSFFMGFPWEKSHELNHEKTCLILWRAEKTRDDIVGNSGQGIYWQGSDITHRPDETHRMGGLGTWRHAEGVPHACTARRTLLLEKITWGQVNPAREQMSPP